jgi:hypothetical protein
MRARGTDAGGRGESEGGNFVFEFLLRGCLVDERGDAKERKGGETIKVRGD